MLKQNPFLIKNVQVFAENKTYINGFIKILDGKIEEFGSMEELASLSTDYEVVDCNGKYAILPGMIDVHIHGVGGADTMDATPEALETMQNYLPIEGTTSYLATTITQSNDMIEKALINVANYLPNQRVDGAELLGIHLEGPFISKVYVGAQPKEFIIKPDLNLFKKWQSLANNSIKLVTIAPEEENGLELVGLLKDMGVVASIGHSNATSEQVNDAFLAGATHVTHLFNGMRGLHHREPGTVGAALSNNELYVEVIADGIHVHPEAIRLAYKLKTSEKIILITDSLRAKCLNSGIYDLGGQKVTVSETKALLDDGTLAGSILKMNKAAHNFMCYTNCTVREIIQVTSTNPAKQLNVFERKGSIKEGKDADLIIIDENFKVQMTFCRGCLAFMKE